MAVRINFGPVYVDFPNPRFNDLWSFGAQRAMNMNRNGGVFFYRKNTWPKNYRYQFVFDRVKKQLAHTYLGYLYTYCGQKVTITNHYGFTYSAIILYPATPIKAVYEPKPDPNDPDFQWENTLMEVTVEVMEVE